MRGFFCVKLLLIVSGFNSKPIVDSETQGDIMLASGFVGTLTVN
jgi:hypothetical protein